VLFLREMVCGVGLEDVGAGRRAGGEVEVEAADADIFREINSI
jgi:hypothetical protein